MKKNYEAPIVEKIAFQYRDQVVAASGCISVWIKEGGNSCPEQDQEHFEHLN